MTGWIPLIATRIQDALGNLLASGTLTVQPTDQNDRPFSAASGGIGGPISMVPGPITILNGALQGPAQVPDTSQTGPANICLRITVRDVLGNVVYVLRQVQTGGLPALDLDNFSGTNTDPLPLFTRGPKGDTGSPGSFGPTVKTATQIGCTTDGTDCTAQINSFFASSSALSPHYLLLDAPGMISHRGIVLGANGYGGIIGMGDSTGLFLMSGSNVDSVALGYTGADTGSNPPAIAAQNILLQNFRIDGNRAGQRGNQAGYVWTFGINITGCRNIRIQNVTVEHASTYSIRLGNVSNFLVDGCHLMPFLEGEAVSANNTDGLHINGPAQHGRIANCHGRTGDDFISLAGPEGYTGPISYLAIANCTMNGCQTGIRFYGNSETNVGTVSGVTVTNLSGTVNVVAFIFGNNNPHSPKYFNTITDISIDNAQIAAPQWTLVADNISAVQFTNCTWLEPTQGTGFLSAWTNSTTWTGITFANCRIVRDPNGNSASAIVDTTTLPSGKMVTLAGLTIRGFGVVDVGYPGQAYYGQLPVLNLAANTTVVRLQTSGLDYLFTSLLALAGTNATTAAQYNSIFGQQSVQSTDLLHLLPVPDAIVASGSMYYSLDHSNLLSMDIAGTGYTISVTSH